MENQRISEHPALLFLKTLYLLVQTARIYNDNNKLIKEALEKFKNILKEVTRTANLDIQIWRGRFYIDGEKLPYKREDSDIVKELIEYFDLRGIGGVLFFVTSQGASPETLIKFLRLLDDSATQKNPFDWLEQKISANGLVWTQIIKKKDEGEKEEVVNEGKRRREKAKTSYAYALSLIKEVADKSSQDVVGARKAKRLAQTVVDLIREDLSLVLGLSTIKDHDDYTYTHSVNVALLSTSLGQQIGLPKTTLEYLCIRGFFHDLGKIEISPKILNKDGKLSAEEWKTVQKHPIVGVKKILRFSTDKVMRLKVVPGPFEHHLNSDMTGYPQTHFLKKISLMGKILRIADVYEALTADRIYRKRSFTPVEATKKMWDEIEKSFDPILLKSFILMLGIYPVGSIVELNNGEKGIVINYPKGSPKDRPEIQMLLNDDEDRWIRGERISLADQTVMEGPFQLNIVRSLHPSELGVQVAHFFVEDEEEYPQTQTFDRDSLDDPIPVYRGIFHKDLKLPPPLSS
jgi:HD-GYP domain-containing protein (c-di-GMP phosphodiesterase class II)